MKQYLKQITRYALKMTAICRRLFQLLLEKIHSADGSSASKDIKEAFRHVNTRYISGNILRIIIAVYFLSGIYVVKPGEAAVITRFGKVVNPKVTEGLHYRLPWPVDKETLVNVTEVRRESVGLSSPEPEHPRHPEKPGKLQVLSGDTNIVDYEVIVQYQVRDPADYLFNIDYAPYQTIRDAVRAAVTKISAETAVDNILTSERQDVLNRLREETQTLLDNYKSGLSIVSVNFQKAYPPEEVADAFRDVSSAREDKDKAMNQAEGYKNSVIPEARGQAQKLITEASSSAQAQINEASGSAVAFNEILAQYRTNSTIYGEAVTRFRLYLERMEKIFPRVKAYIVKPGEKVNLKLIEGNENTTIFPPQTEGGR
jgi:membrane protease subunit HflK